MLVKSNLSASASAVVPAGVGGVSTNFFDSGKQDVADHNANLSANPDAGALIQNGFTSAGRSDGPGIDAKTQMVAVPGGTSSIDVTFTTTADNYYPGGFDLSSPLKCLLVIDKDQAVNGTAVSRDNSTNPAPYVLGGDVITYTVPVRVAGDVDVTDAVLTDVAPVGTTAVPGSVKVGKGQTPAAAVAALVAGGSIASNTVTAGLGTLNHPTGSPATCAADKACFGAVQFQVTVNASLPAGTVLSNQAGVTFSASGATGITEQSNEVTDRVGASLTVSKTITGAVDGDPTTFGFTVVCDGKQIPGSPFSLGNGGTRSVAVPPGQTCSVTETTNPNFAVSMAGAVTANGGSTLMSQDRTVDVTNTRLMGRIKVTKTARSVSGDPAPAPTFRFTVSCPGVAGYPRDLTVTGSGTAETPSDIPFGAGCVVTEQPTAGWVQSGSQSIESVDQAVEQVNFTNTRQTGSLIIDKSAVGADGTFNFSVDCDGTAWDVVRAITTTGGSGRSSAITDIPAGVSCTVSESDQVGWALTASPAGPLTIVAGQQVTAAFTDTHQTADLVITKAISGGTAVPVSGSFDVDVDCGPDGVFHRTVDASTATNGSVTVPGMAVGASCAVTEQVPTGWAIDTAVTGNTNPRRVTIAAHDNAVTFTNRRLVGSITIDKRIDQGSGTFRFDVTCGKVVVAGSPFEITINAPATSGSRVIDGIPSGSNCVVDEHPNGSVLDDFVQTTPPEDGVVTFARTAETQTASFVDHRRTGDLVIAKEFPPKSLGDPDREFSFSWDCGPLPRAGTLKAGAHLTVNDIPTGTTCHVSEEADAAYTATMTPADGSVVIGDDGPNTVTVTNTRRSGTVEIRKHLAPVTDPGRFDLALDGTVAASNVGDGATTGPIAIPIGTHRVTEAVTAGATVTLADYATALVCTDGDQPVAVSDDTTVLVSDGAAIVCTFTNSRRPLLQLTKTVSPSDDAGRFSLTVDGAARATGGDGTTSPFFASSIGAHVIGEVAGDDTTRIDDYTSAIECRAGGGAGAVVSSTSALTLAAGDRVRCTITNTVKPLVDLAVLKTLPATSLTVGDQPTYSLEVSNNGPATATGIAVRDTLPAQLTAISASGSGWTCTVAGKQIDCSTASTLAKGAKLPVISVLVRVSSAETNVINTATVSGTKEDRDLTNNSSTVTTPVVEVQANSQIRPLAITGTAVLVRLTAGALMMAGGVVLLLFARRRRR